MGVVKPLFFGTKPLDTACSKRSISAKIMASTIEKPQARGETSGERIERLLREFDTALEGLNKTRELQRSLNEDCSPENVEKVRFTLRRWEEKTMAGKI